MTESSDGFESAGGNSLDSRAPISVLLIDDQKLIGKMVQRLLIEETDVALRHCCDPEMALQAAAEFKPTVILLDLVMPRIGGLELLTTFRGMDEWKDIPIIVLSGKEEAKTKARAFELGANDYLVKLPEVVELVARIRHHSQGYTSLLERNEAMRALGESRRKLELRNRFIRETFGKFLSDDVVDSVLENPAGVRLGGEQRTVTIMMTDLRGFTALSERHPAEEVVALINNYLGVMTDVILKHHGTIIEFLGDAVFAIFGAPISHGNDAANAVAAAVEMQCAMEKVNRLNASQELPETEMGIGLNTGEIIVGNIGSEKRVKYGAVGSQVNLAARIESYSVGRQILISESCREAVGNILLERGVLKMRAKGVAEPINVYDITGIGGEFNLHMPELEPEPLHEPGRALNVRYNVVEGKHSGGRFHDGRITRLNLKEAEIQSLVSIEKHANVKFRLVDNDGEEFLGDMYGKVLEGQESGFKLHFTALPPANEAFIRGVLYSFTK